MSFNNSQTRHLARILGAVIEQPRAKLREAISPGLFIYGKISNDVVKDLQNYFSANPDAMGRTVAKDWFEDECTLKSLAYENVIALEGYRPNDVTGLPTTKIIVAISKPAMIECIYSAFDGPALPSNDVKALVDALVSLSALENRPVKNREASAMIKRHLNIFDDPVEALRAVVETATGTPMLIKSKDALNEIRDANNAAFDLLIEIAKNNGPEFFAPIFNRYKPIFMALRQSRRKDVRPIINRISKLSKTMHKPMPDNPLNSIAHTQLNESNMHWADNANIETVLRAVSYLGKLKFSKASSARMFMIRNGRYFVKDDAPKVDMGIVDRNWDILCDVIRKRIGDDGLARKVYMEPNVDLPVAASAKNWVGNVPGLTIISSDDTLLVGCYWHSDGGADDLDLSTTFGDEKIGWDGSPGFGGVNYSGDRTTAYHGAAEYMKISRKMCNETFDDAGVVHLNVYSGSPKSDYSIVVANDCSYSEIIDGSSLIARADRTTSSTASLLGFWRRDNEKIEFMVSDLDAGSSRVASCRTPFDLEGAYMDRFNRLSLKALLTELGIAVVDDPSAADIDLSLTTLTPQTMMEIFNEN